MSRLRLRGIAALGAKAAVSAGLIAFVLRGIDADVVVAHIRQTELASVLGATLITTAVAILHARRWEIVLARMEHEIPYVHALRLVIIGYFFNQTLPSTIGGDAYRAWGAYKLGIHAGNAVTSVVVDRILALASLLAMILCGAWWLVDLIPAPMARAGLGLVIVGGAAGIATLLCTARFAPILQRWRATRFLVQLSRGTNAVLSSPAAAMQAVALTMAGYAALSYAVYLLARGMGVDLGFGYALLLVPLVTLITVLPVSIAGWGLRESAMVVALGLIGVPSAQAFSLSVLLGLVTMASGIPGGVVWLAARRDRLPSPAEAR